ncbi:AGA (predicted) [Pycnogonum litorale]
MPKFNQQNHDTIGMIVFDRQGNIAAGTSTNGLNHKIPGRVGDSPIPGAGAYADMKKGGAAVCTGNGDFMMRFLPSYHAVQLLSQGESAQSAATHAIEPIIKHHPNLWGAVVVATTNGQFGVACHGMSTFKYSVVDARLAGAGVQVREVKCIQ